MKAKGGSLSHTAIIAIGYLLVIACGTALLALPVSSKGPGGASFADALFTATSASCVTGLVVRDTWAYWSRFGQSVILALIQLGGLGFMMFAALILSLAKKRMGLKQKELLSDSISLPRIGGILGFARKTAALTAGIELAGAALLAIRLCPELGAGEGLYASVFLSVSAFCNAGFDLCGRLSEYSSLTHYAMDPLVTMVISGLIITGGLGFLVWEDILVNRARFGKYSLHAKIVLLTTAALLLGGTLLFYVFERNATGAGMGTGGRLLTAWFSSVTARTAGFNSVDTAALSEPSKLLTILLMAIGGSPGSTAGGIKTTTLFVLLASAASYVRLKRSTGVMNRQLEEGALKKSVAVLLSSLTISLTATLLLCALDSLSITDALFECFSATGTVGMTTGITRSLSPASRAILILCMYCGRLGSLSFAMALAERGRPADVRLPAETVGIG